MRWDALAYALGYRSSTLDGAVPPPQNNSPDFNDRNYTLDNSGAFIEEHPVPRTNSFTVLKGPRSYPTELR